MTKKRSQSNQLDLFEKPDVTEVIKANCQAGSSVAVIGLYDKNLQAFVFVNMADFNEFEANHDNKDNTEQVIEDFLKVHELIKFSKS